MTGTNWNGWKITDEQAEGIRNGNAEARSRFYLENLDRIRAMAYAKARMDYKLRGMVEDLVQQVLVDMTLWTYANNTPIKNGNDITAFIRKTFDFTPYGGVAYLVVENTKILCNGDYRLYCVSLDAPTQRRKGRNNDADGSELSVFIADERAEKSFEEVESVDYLDDCKRIAGEYLAPREKDFFNLLLEGYAPSVAIERLNMKQWGAISKRLRAKLIVNYAEIVEKLSLCVGDIPRYATQPPDGYTKAVEFLAPPNAEQKARTAQ